MSFPYELYYEFFLGLKKDFLKLNYLFPVIGKNIKSLELIIIVSN
jgi:hypothetical protein